GCVGKRGGCEVAVTVRFGAGSVCAGAVGCVTGGGWTAVGCGCGAGIVGVCACWLCCTGGLLGAALVCCFHGASAMPAATTAAAASAPTAIHNPRLLSGFCATGGCMPGTGATGGGPATG